MKELLVFSVMFNIAFFVMIIFDMWTIKDLRELNKEHEKYEEILKDGQNLYKELSEALLKKIREIEKNNYQEPI